MLLVMSKINYVLAHKNMSSKPHVAKSIETHHTKYIRCSSPRKPHNNLHSKHKGRSSMKDVSSGRRKKGFGKVQKFTWKDDDVEEEDEDSVDEMEDEGITCLRLNDNSDPGEHFVLSVETCLHHGYACVDGDSSVFHVNY